MATAFVLIKISAGDTSEKEVRGKLLSIDEIIELHPLFGEFDYIGKVETESFSELGRVVIERIRTIEGVVDTKTLTKMPI